MSSSDSQRAQIMFHLYTKLFNVVGEARNTSPSPAPKLDKWFNMENPDSELFSKDRREAYKGVPPRGLEVQVLLTVPELGHNEVLVHLPPNQSRVRMQPVPRFVLLETFALDVVAGPAADVPLATIYKHCILLFRSLFTLLRALPAWRLHKRLRRRAASLGITLRVGSGDDCDVVSLSNAETRTHVFPALPHPMGSFTLSTRYLAHPAFQLDELESVLSSRFLSQDQRPFTPTLARASSPTLARASPSSPPRPTLARASPSPPSLPRSSLAKTLHAASRAQLPSSTCSLSPSSSFEARPRHPFPFKSNTVSSSATAFPTASPFRERVASLPHAPARTGPIPLHVRQTSLSRPDDAAVSTSTSTATSASTSASASATRRRYSSSFGHRYATPPSPSPSVSPSTARPVPPAPPSPRPIPRRTGSTGANARSSIGNRVRTDDEDISAFVHDIDMRKPLVGGRGRGRGEERADDPVLTALQHPMRTTGFDSSQFTGPSPSALGCSPNLEPEPEAPQHDSRHAQSPPDRQVLTTEAEIDARLLKMNEAFLRSLQGLGSERGAGGERGAGSGNGQQRREWARARSTSGVWSGMPQGVLVRQGSQEVVGRMEMDSDGDGDGDGGVDLGGLTGMGRFRF